VLLHKLIFWNKTKKRSYPNVGDTMRDAVEIATELNIVHDKQLEAERQRRPDISMPLKARYEALLWVLGKDNATSTIR